MIGVVPIRHARVGLDGGKHHIGQSVHPGQDGEDIKHLRPAVQASAKGASSPLARWSVRIHHGLPLGPLLVFPRLLFHPVGVSTIGKLPGHRWVIVQQQEGHQAHQHHGTEEEEKHLC